MRVATVAIILSMSVLEVRAQSDEPQRWEVSTALAYGSENNYGNPGFMVINEYEYLFRGGLSASGKLTAFHSVPWFHPEGFTFSFSGLSAGAYLNYTTRFNVAKNFVKFSAGPGYFHSNSMVIDSNTTAESYGRFGYGLGLEGGSKVGEKVSLGLLLNIYSYDIFGDIIVIGCNAHFRL